MSRLNRRPGAAWSAKRRSWASRHVASDRSPSPSSRACSAPTSSKGTTSTSVVMTRACGTPRPSVTMPSAPGAGSSSPAAS